MKMAVDGGKVTKQLLRAVSGEFEIESIHFLYLKKQDINDLGCLGECDALQILDLSYNDITKLYSLAGLVNITHLNLSANRITSLEGLQSLEKLEYINLAGNLIGSIDSLNILACLEHLKELRLQDKIKQLKNPVCLNMYYKQNVFQVLPRLSVLDGEQHHGDGKDYYNVCSEIDAIIAKMMNKANQNTTESETHPTEPWLDATFWAPDDDLHITKAKSAEQQLRELLRNTKKQLDDVDQHLKSISGKP